MLSDAERSKAADILMEAHRTKKQAVQLTTTFPAIAIEDSYAISTEVAKRKMTAGAKLIGHKVGLDLQGDAALLDDRRAGFRLHPRRPDDRRRRQGEARRLLQAARRGRALLRHGQAPARARRRPRRGAARHRIRHPGDRDRRRPHPGPAQDLRHRRRQWRRRRHRARRPPGRTAGRRPALGRRHHVPQFRDRGDRACRRRARPSGARRRLARQQARPASAPRSSPATWCSPVPSPAWCSRRRATRCTPISGRSAASPSSSSSRALSRSIRDIEHGRIPTQRLQSTRSPPANCRSACGRACAATSPPRSFPIPASTGSCSTPSIRRTRFPIFCRSCRRCSAAPRRRSCGRPGTTRCWPSAFSTSARRRCCFPMCRTPEEAKRAVASTRYPPQGIRGVSVAARASRYGRVPGYLTKANDEICVLVQVETGAGACASSKPSPRSTASTASSSARRISPLRSAISAIRSTPTCRRRSRMPAAG